MFDRTIIQPGPSSIHAEVHEHRAPTDESVKILRDAEERAQKRLLSVTRLENNTFNATWHVERHFDNYHLNVMCRFMLNGTTHKIDFTIDELKLSNDKDALINTVRENILAKMTEILTFDLFHSHSKLLR